jgi:hypothetical protein
MASGQLDFVLVYLQRRISLLDKAHQAGFISKLVNYHPQ